MTEGNQEPRGSRYSPRAIRFIGFTARSPCSSDQRNSPDCDRHEQRERLRRQPPRPAAAPACPPRSRRRRAPSARRRRRRRRRRSGRRGRATKGANACTASRRAPVRAKPWTCLHSASHSSRSSSVSGRTSTPVGRPLARRAAHHDAGRRDVETERRVEGQRAHVEAVLQEPDAAARPCRARSPPPSACARRRRSDRRGSTVIGPTPRDRVALVEEVGARRPPVALGDDSPHGGMRNPHPHHARRPPRAPGKSRRNRWWSWMRAEGLEARSARTPRRPLARRHEGSPAGVVVEIASMMVSPPGSTTGASIRRNWGAGGGAGGRKWDTRRRADRRACTADSRAGDRPLRRRSRRSTGLACAIGGPRRPQRPGVDRLGAARRVRAVRHARRLLRDPRGGVPELRLLVRAGRVPLLDHDPAFYRATAIWSSQEGSLLLWVLLLSGWSSAILFLTRRRAREVAPYATAVLLGHRGVLRGAAGVPRDAVRAA